MAKAYQALADVSIPKPVSRVNPEDEKSDWVTEGATYPAGSIISEEWMTPRDRKRAEDGELDHLLRASDVEVPDGYVDGGQFNAPEQGVFIAEHEAERTALEAGGHIVIPDQQKMEVLSSSARHDREYQEAHADDSRRPILEHLHQERPRVPDELLHGRETGAGVQHFRGSGDQGEALSEVQEALAQNSENEESNSDDTEATRPAPGSSSEGTEQQAEPQTVTGG